MNAKRGLLNLRRVEADAVSLAFRVGELGSAEAAMMRRIFERIERRPEASFGVMSALTHYAEVQHMCQAEVPFATAAPRPQFTAVTPLTESVVSQAG